jgi:hypothetical protein
LASQASQPLFVVAIRYTTPDLALSVPESGVGFLHRSGVKVALGYNADGQPVALTESDHYDPELLRLVTEANPLGEPSNDDPETVRFMDELRRSHRQAAEDIVTVTRWTLLRPGGHRALLNRRNARYRVRGEEEWRILPMRPGAPHTWICGRTNIDETRRQAIQTAAGGEWDEPLAHLILRDAKEQLYSSPRAAVVLTWAALETALRQQLVRLPSPPPGQSRRVHGQPWDGPSDTLHGELVDLFKRAYRRRPDRWLTLPTAAMATLEATREARVEVVHRAGAPPSAQDLHAVVRLAQDVLYMLDYQVGHEWAADYVGYASGMEGDIVIGQPVFAGELPPD